MNCLATIWLTTQVLTVSSTNTLRAAIREKWCKYSNKQVTGIEGGRYFGIPPERKFLKIPTGNFEKRRLFINIREKHSNNFYINSTFSLIRLKMELPVQNSPSQQNGPKCPSLWTKIPPGNFSHSRCLVTSNVNNIYPKIIT